MPSKNMLPKGARRHTVKHEYRATRGVEPPAPPIVPLLDLDEDADVTDPDANASSPPSVRTFPAAAQAAGLRLDQYLAQAIPDISRARVQLLIEAGQVTVDGLPAKPKHKLQGGETLQITGSPQPAPLHATPEDIPLDIVFEDQHLAVVNKGAGMMVHAGAAGAPAPQHDADPSAPDARNSGTLVNALLHHFSQLSHVSGDLRPGIVHRLDKQTSGLIVVAKDDSTHRKLGAMFSAREVQKTYLALVHGSLAKDAVTVTLPIGRDLLRRVRMTTRRAADNEGVRSAISHVTVLKRIATPLGAFTLVEVRIETGRTHQIRVHMQSLGHPVVGDTLYGAPRRIGPPGSTLSLERNFLHAARLAFTHPQTGERIALEAPLPPELETLLETLRQG